MFYFSSQEMQVKGLKCGINMPKMVRGRSGLPPYAPQDVHLVDDYEACPETWMRSSENAKSYFVAAKLGKGMWLDFTECERFSHHVAIRLSIQGIDPLTGMKTEHFYLHQYRKSCPMHNIPLQDERFCPECGYKWAPQNYLATTAGGKLWIDGFMTMEGIVRQYYFTEDMARGVAAQMIGKERVYCIGIAFYLSKHPRPIPRIKPPTFETCSYDHLLGGTPIMRGGATKSCGSSQTFGSTLGGSYRSIEIGAGDEIKQRIGVDPKRIDYWQEEPEGLIYINYGPEEQIQEILAAGKRDRPISDLGAFSGLNVGNPFKL